MQTLHCLQSTNLPSLFDLLDDCLEPFVRVIAKIIPTAKIADIAIKRMPFLLVELTGMVRYLWVKIRQIENWSSYINVRSVVLTVFYRVQYILTRDWFTSWNLVRHWLPVKDFRILVACYRFIGQLAPKIPWVPEVFSRWGRQNWAAKRRRRVTKRREKNFWHQRITTSLPCRRQFPLIDIHRQSLF